MTKRLKKGIAGTVSFASILFVIGTAGAVENDIITLDAGVIRGAIAIAILFAAIVWGGLTE